MEFEDETIQINVFNPKDFKKKVPHVKKKDSSLQILKDFKETFKRKIKVASPKSLIQAPKDKLFNSSKKLNIEQKDNQDVKETDQKLPKRKIMKKNNENVSERTTLIVNKDSIKEKVKEPLLKKKSTEIKTKSSSESDVKPHTKLKRKLKSGKDMEKPKRFKSSVIHNHDMETPTIQKLDVVPVNENVFSKKKFSTLNLHDFMVSNLTSMGMENLTEVQQKSIPPIMQGRDILIKSQTGSGKTLTYSIPIVNQLQGIEPRISRGDGPYCVVVVPTRELVMQTYKVFLKLVKPFVWLVPGYLMGGEKRKSEKSRLKKGMNIIISTPGRLIDHLDNTCFLDLSNIKFLVVDEADRMFEMGFEKDVSKVVKLVQQKVSSAFQTILLSATLSSGVEKLAGMTLEDPVKIDIVNQDKKNNNNNKNENNDETFSTPSNLKQHFVVVPTKLRLVTLASLLLCKCQLSTNPCKMIVFVTTQDSVEFHHSLLELSLFSPDDDDDDDEWVDDGGGGSDDDGDGGGKSGGGSSKGGGGVKKPSTKLFKLYGDLEQKDRMRIFNDFHKVKSGVLFCTDVAARGLDLPHIDWIIQYNTPATPTDYIHKVGRTARIGTHGNAVLFLAPSETEYVKVLAEHRIGLVEMKMNDILAKLLLEVQLGKIDLSNKGHVPRTVQDAASGLQTRLESTLATDSHLRSLARKAYQSFIRSYARYPASMKHIFHVKNLHLGYLATSFALSESPTSTSKLINKSRKKEAENQKLRDKRDRAKERHKSSFKAPKRAFSHTSVSEFI